MANFNKAYKKTAASEGGYSNDPEDPGLETYCGISRRHWPKWPGWKEIDRHKKTNGPIKTNQKLVGADLATEVKIFYLRYFWNPLKCEQIESQAIAESLFDYGVNRGKRPAVRDLQDTVNDCRVKFAHVAPLKVDGIIGPKTLRAVNKSAHFIKAFDLYFTAERISFYMGLAEKKPVNRKFLKGWIRRSLKSL